MRRLCVLMTLACLLSMPANALSVVTADYDSDRLEVERLFAEQVDGKAVAAHKEMAADFMTLLGALPPGQVKSLLKNEVCGPILKKYGITGGKHGKT